MICRRIYLFLVTMSMMFLIGCAQTPTIKKVDLDEYGSYFLESKSGFIVVTNIGYMPDEKATLYLETLQQVLEEENLSSIQYDVYMSDGTNKNKSNVKHINPYSDVTHTETLHYVVDGEVVSSFDLTNYEGLELRNELENYIKLVSK